MQSEIDRLKRAGKIRTSETYASALSSFRRFRGGKDVALRRISGTLMQEYEAWLTQRGLIPNSIGFYLRILRAVYNRAVREEKTSDRRPFDNVYTGVAKTMKRALPLSAIRKIAGLDLSESPAIDYARDIFMMSFYLRGMSFIDMAFLKKSDLRHGSVSYRRHKTGQHLTIGWEPEMQRILDKYPRNPTKYLLPIITAPTADERKTYRNRSYNINRNLKEVAKRAGIATSLTLYVARHSWASIARTEGIPLSVISAGMGHDSEATTRIYLSALDTALVDRANSRILRRLRR